MWLGEQYLDLEEFLQKASGYGFLVLSVLVFSFGALSFYTTTAVNTVRSNLTKEEIKSLGTWWSYGIDSLLASPALLIPLFIYILFTIYIYVINKIQQSKEDLLNKETSE